jgi:hypothetical protein
MSRRRQRVDFRVSILIGTRKAKDVRECLQAHLRDTAAMQFSDHSDAINVTVLRRRPFWQFWH